MQSMSHITQTGNCKNITCLFLKNHIHAINRVIKITLLLILMFGVKIIWSFWPVDVIHHTADAWVADWIIAFFIFFCPSIKRLSINPCIYFKTWRFTQDYLNKNNVLKQCSVNMHFIAAFRMFNSVKLRFFPTAEPGHTRHFNILCCYFKNY